MKGFVYVSEARAAFDATSLRTLETEAAATNRHLGVTGYLYFEKNRFVQYVEGEPGTIDALAGRIEKDPRHQFLKTLQEDGLQTRRFPVWSMRYVTRDALIEMRLEHLLSDHLLFLRKIESEGPAWQKAAWIMVNGLAQLQNHAHWGKVNAAAREPRP